MLAEVFSSFDNSSLSRAEQNRAEVSICCALLGGMLHSFDRGFTYVSVDLDFSEGLEAY